MISFDFDHIPQNVAIFLKQIGLSSINDNLVELYLNPLYLFPIAGVSIFVLLVYVFGFTSTNKNPPTLQLFVNSKDKKNQKKKKDKKDVKITKVNTNGNLLNSEMAKAKVVKAQANLKTTTTVEKPKINEVQVAKKKDKIIKSPPQEKKVLKPNSNKIKDDDGGEWIEANRKKNRKTKDDPKILNEQNDSKVLSGNKESKKKNEASLTKINSESSEQKSSKTNQINIQNENLKKNEDIKNSPKILQNKTESKKSNKSSPSTEDLKQNKEIVAKDAAKNKNVLSKKNDEKLQKTPKNSILESTPKASDKTSSNESNKLTDKKVIQPAKESKTHRIPNTEELIAEDPIYPPKEEKTPKKNRKSKVNDKSKDKNELNVSALLKNESKSDKLTAEIVAEYDSGNKDTNKKKKVEQRIEKSEKLAEKSVVEPVLNGLGRDHEVREETKVFQKPKPSKKRSRKEE